MDDDVTQIFYRSPALPIGVLLKVFACERFVEEDILESVGVSTSRCERPRLLAGVFGRFACAEKP